MSPVERTTSQLFGSARLLFPLRRNSHALRLRRRSAGGGGRARTLVEFTADQRVGHSAVITGLCHQMRPAAVVARAVKVAVATWASRGDADRSDWSTKCRLISI